MTFAIPRYVRRGVGALSCTLFGGLMACAPSEPAMEAFEFVELESPAGAGSGEAHLSLHGDAAVLSWLEPVDTVTWELNFARLGADGAWGRTGTIATRDDFFVNWADFPSVEGAPGGGLAAHWLQRGGEGTYDYGVRLTFSHDDGRTWSEPWTPHEDGTPTEHGFVSTMALESGWGFVWLDGRRFAETDSTEATREMTLRFRRRGWNGSTGDERLLDGRICDCCQTDAAVVPGGAIVVYRDRSPDEVRDIYVTRLRDGHWSEGVPVAEDGWVIGGCPVNGPAVAADDERVAVAWFTGARDTAAVEVAFSEDGGTSFGTPVRVDGGQPVGRTDVVLTPEGAVVSWLEQVGTGEAELRVRRVSSEGSTEPHQVVAQASASRASGFPQMVVDAEGRLLFAWTDVRDDETQVRVARTRGAVR